MKRRLPTVATFLVTIALSACGGGATVGTPVGAVSRADSIVPSATRLALPAAASVAGIAIDAGGGAIGSWQADQDYSGGVTSRVAQAINTSAAENAAPQNIYQTQRYGSRLTYTISNLSPSGAYLVRLHFAETFFKTAGRRIFNVTINGTSVLTKFDIFVAAGGADTALVRVFSTTADRSGTIVIRFAATTNNASVAGIEVVSAATNPTPTPTPVSGSKGVMSGVVPSSLSAWRSWLGKPVKLVGAYNDIGASNWSGLDDIVWQSSVLAGNSLVWSLATYPSSSSLAAVAGGAGNSYYAAWAFEILTHANPAPDGIYYIRPNWEVPDPWSSWSNACAASPANCIGAFRQIAAVFHGTSPKFKLVWDTLPVYVNGSIVTTDNSMYYPGDAYVDVVSEDVYVDTSGSSSPQTVWNYALNRANGLNWLTSFAAAHNKRIAVSEWGIDSDNAGPLVVALQNWLSANRAVYQNYFDGGSTQLSNGQYPDAGAVVRSYF